MTKDLTKLRTEIDAIDQKIINLLENRMKIVKRVKEIKQNNGEKLFMRPEREFNMIANLIKFSNKQLADDFIFDVWRKIISYANFLEQDLKIDLFNPENIPCYKYILNNFYNSKFPISNFNEQFLTSLKKLENDKIHMIIVNLFEKKTNNSCWWVDLFHNITPEIRLFTATSPRIITENIQLFSIGKIKATPSKHDKTIFVVKDNGQFSYNKNSQLCLLNSINIDDHRFYLFEIDGFYNKAQDLAIKLNLKEDLRILGNYPILK